jgi:hypothetical protein
MTDSSRHPNGSMAEDLLSSVSNTPHEMEFLTMPVERTYRNDSVVKALLVGKGYSDWRRDRSLGKRDLSGATLLYTYPENYHTKYLSNTGRYLLVIN